MRVNVIKWVLLDYAGDFSICPDWYRSKGKHVLAVLGATKPKTKSFSEVHTQV